MAQSKKQRVVPSEEKQVQQEDEESSTQEETSTEDEVSTEEEPEPKPQSQPSKSGTKRAASSSSAAEEKKSGNQTQSKLFQRFWSEEDELVILKGMADFSSKKGQNPYIHCESFLSFVKDKLHVNPTTVQLKDKIQRLKKRFQNNARKVTISNPHEQKVFHLSKKVWDTNNNHPDQNPNPKPQPEPEPEPETNPETEMELGDEVVGLDESGNDDSDNVDLLFMEMSRPRELNEEEMKRRLRLIEKSKRKELEEKWKDLRDEENDLAVKRTQLIAEQVQSIVEALKSSRG